MAFFIQQKYATPLRNKEYDDFEESKSKQQFSISKIIAPHQFLQQSQQLQQQVHSQKQSPLLSSSDLRSFRVIHTNQIQQHPKLSSNIFERKDAEKELHPEERVKEIKYYYTSNDKPNNIKFNPAHYSKASKLLSYNNYINRQSSTQSKDIYSIFQTPNPFRRASQDILFKLPQEKNGQQVKIERNSSLPTFESEGRNNSQMEDDQTENSILRDFGGFSRKEGKSPLVSRRKERAQHEEDQLQKQTDTTHLYDKQLYYQLRQQFSNQNLKTQVDLTNPTHQEEILNKKAENSPHLYLNEQQFRKSVEKLLRNKMNYTKRFVSNSQQEKQMTLRLLEKQSRKYHLSEGDEVRNMITITNKLRELKERLLKMTDFSKVTSVRKAVERRIIAKSKQVLGIPFFISFILFFIG